MLFGGTSGSLFNADVHILDLRTKSYKEVKAMGAPKPRCVFSERLRLLRIETH